MPSVKVRGMRCENCKKAVEEALAKAPGVQSPVASLEKGEVSWTEAEGKPASLKTVVEAIKDMGFDAG